MPVAALAKEYAPSVNRGPADKLSYDLAAKFFGLGVFLDVLMNELTFIILLVSSASKRLKLGNLGFDRGLFLLVGLNWLLESLVGNLAFKVILI